MLVLQQEFDPFQREKRRAIHKLMLMLICRQSTCLEQFLVNAKNPKKQLNQIKNPYLKKIFMCWFDECLLMLYLSLFASWCIMLLVFCVIIFLLWTTLVVAIGRNWNQLNIFMLCHCWMSCVEMRKQRWNLTVQLMSKKGNEVNFYKICICLIVRCYLKINRFLMKHFLKRIFKKTSIACQTNVNFHYFSNSANKKRCFKHWISAYFPFKKILQKHIFPLKCLFMLIVQFTNCILIIFENCVNVKSNGQ